jgi:hypothetical protein
LRRVDEKMQPIPGTEFVLKADLVLLAMGFVHPVQDGMIKPNSASTRPRKNVAANTLDYKTSVEKVFACGDMRRGQSLVVWAIREGRQAARAIDEFLMGQHTPGRDRRRRKRNHRAFQRTRRKRGQQRRIGQGDTEHFVDRRRHQRQRNGLRWHQARHRGTGNPAGRCPQHRHRNDRALFD